MLPFIIAGYMALNMWKIHHAPDVTSSFGFWGELLSQSNIVSQILAGGFVLLNAILLNTLFNRNGFMESNNFLPSMLYVIFASIFHSFYFLDGFVIAQTLLVLAVFQLLKLNQNEDARRIVFNAAFLIGLACTFYPLMLTLIIFLFWMIWVIRPFIIRESVLTLIGLSIPLIYAGIYGSVYNIRITNQEFSSSSPELWLEDITVMGGVIFFMIIFGAKALSTKLQQSSIRLKKLFRMILILSNYALLLAILEYFVFHKKEALSLVLIPLMFFLPYAFGYKNPRSTTVTVFYLLLLFSVGKFFFPLSF
jgi:hypothetical protein